MTTLLFGVVLLLGAVSPVYADTIRIDLGSVGSAAAVGTAASDGYSHWDTAPRHSASFAFVGAGPELSAR